MKEDPFESGEAEEAADASPQVKAEPENAAMDGGAAVGSGEGAGADGALPEEGEHAEVEVPQEEAVQMPATQDDPGAQLGVRSLAVRDDLSRFQTLVAPLISCAYSLLCSTYPESVSVSTYCRPQLDTAFVCPVAWSKHICTSLAI